MCYFAYLAVRLKGSAQEQVPAAVEDVVAVAAASGVALTAAPPAAGSTLAAFFAPYDAGFVLHGTGCACDFGDPELDAVKAALASLLGTRDVSRAWFARYFVRGAALAGEPHAPPLAPRAISLRELRECSALEDDVAFEVRLDGPPWPTRSLNHAAREAREAPRPPTRRTTRH